MGRAALRCILRHCGVPKSTPHSSGFARLADEAFTKPSVVMVYYGGVFCMKGQVKDLLIIIRTTPFNTVSVPEALRMSIGLTVHDNRVSILLIDDGVWNSLRVAPHTIGRPDINDSLELFSACGIRIFADEASLKERNIAECDGKIEKISRQEAIGLIVESDVLLNFG